MITLPDDINGDPALLAVERAVAELRRGRAVCVRGVTGGAIAAAIETTSPRLLEQLLEWSSSAASGEADVCGPPQRNFPT
jgi:hypothetical protein